MLLIICILPIFLLSCASGINGISPKVQRINSDYIQEFHIVNKINITNGQPSKVLHTIGQDTGQGFIVNLHVFTSKAVEALRKELAQRGMTVTSDTSKKLKLAVTNVEITSGWRLKCAVAINIESEKEYTANFKAKNISPANINRVCGGAITRAITKMFNDRDFIGYLTD